MRESLSVDDAAAILGVGRAHVLNMLGRELEATSLDGLGRAAGEEIRISVASLLRHLRRSGADEQIAGLPHHARR